jgi:hypothetical protein
MGFVLRSDSRARVLLVAFGPTRVVVAPEPASYVSARIVQALRADTRAPIKFVAKIDTALATLGTNCPDLIEV